MSTRTAADWIDNLRLQPHPEGGYFAETYRSTEGVAARALPGRYGGPRAFATNIYFLLPGNQVSHLHRLRSDEAWHFYEGSPLTVHTIDPAGTRRDLRLGRAADAAYQAVVPHGWWFGASVADPDGYALVGCTVAPGFDFADFELADRARLQAYFPQHAELIARLT